MPVLTQETITRYKQVKAMILNGISIQEACDQISWWPEMYARARRIIEGTQTKKGLIKTVSDLRKENARLRIRIKELESTAARPQGEQHGQQHTQHLGEHTERQRVRERVWIMADDG